MKTNSSRKPRAGFTLIELLVVIAIIALLLAILMPALNRARELARSVRCQSNMRGLVTAWHVYASEHDGAIPGSMTYDGVDREWGDIWHSRPWDWVWVPWDTRHGRARAREPYTLEERQEGVRRGSLYPYVDTVDIYNCPSDDLNFRTYQMPDSLNGATGVAWNWSIIKRQESIRSPSSSFVFLEANDPRGYNGYSWVMNPGLESWHNPIAVWHGRHSNMVFADGHSERWRWSPETVELFDDLYYDTDHGHEGRWINLETEGGREDLRRVRNSWPRPR